MLFRLVRPMKRSTSADAYFVQRIPADVKARAAALKLRIPLEGGFVDKTVTAGAADIRFSLKTADKSEVKLRQAAAANASGASASDTNDTQTSIALSSPSQPPSSHQSHKKVC